MQSLAEAPVLLCVQGDNMNADHCNRLQQAGAELLVTSGDRVSQVDQLLDELGKRSFTNVLLEAGTGLLGTFFDGRLVDEVHVFVAPKIVGGTAAMGPVGGAGRDTVPQLASLTAVRRRNIGTDTLIEGYVQHSAERGEGEHA